MLNPQFWMVEPFHPHRGPEPFRRARPVSVDRRSGPGAARGGATPLAGLQRCGPELKGYST